MSEVDPNELSLELSAEGMSGGMTKETTEGKHSNYDFLAQADLL